MSAANVLPRSERAQRSKALAYLESRVREEADAAATASSVEATLVHVVLATAYAKRLNDSWVQEHRVW